MRLLSFTRRSQPSWGAVVGDGILDLAARLQHRSLREALENAALADAADAANTNPPDFGFDEVELLPTIPDPQKIICIGVNYGDRNAEYKDDSAAPKYPSVFMRTRESLVGHGAPIMRPPESEQLDYEGEIVIVIGTEGRRIHKRDAWRHIAGLSLMNEGSVRDWLRHAKFNVTQGKNFARSGSFGPWMVTADEFAPDQSLHLTTKVNGELRQDDTTANLIFPFDYLISYLSTFMHLKPGDIIATGTPTGAGARFDPPKYLHDGDIVEVEVPEIGVLRNRIKDEHA
jgi:5-carboxymethyl-2-hydroxymuconate isomerase